MFSLNTIKVNYIAFRMTLECYLFSPGVQDSLFLPISSVVSVWLVRKDISFYLQTAAIRLPWKYELITVELPQC